jgi:hypothetical protein
VKLLEIFLENCQENIRPFAGIMCEVLRADSILSFVAYAFQCFNVQLITPAPYFTVGVISWF